MRRPVLPLLALLAAALGISTPLAAQSPRASVAAQLPATSARTLATRRLPPVEELPSAPGRPFLTLAQLEQLALQHNPSLSRAAADIRAAEGERVQVGLYPNPVVGLGEQQTGSKGIAEQDGVLLEQEIVTGKKLGLNREVAAREVLWRRQHWEVQRQRILSDVRIEFYNVAIGERQRQVTNDLVEVARKGVESAMERNEGDEIGRNDVIEAKIELYNAEVAAVKGANRALMARQRLAAAVGVAEVAEAQLNGNLEELPPDRGFQETLDAIRARSPEIAAAHVEIDRLRWALKRAGVEKIPNVTASGLYNWRDNGVLGGKPDGAFQFSLPLPIYDRNQGGVQRVTGELMAAERTLRQVELSLQDRLADVFELNANARMQVRKYRDELLPAAREALELTRTAYEAGKVDYNDLLTSQRTNANANLEYLRALKELRTSEMEIEGLLLTGSLDGASR